MMKAVILAGGYGTRISDFDNEESIMKPKPMIEIGGQANFVAYFENLFKLWY